MQVRQRSGGHAGKFLMQQPKPDVGPKRFEKFQDFRPLQRV